MSELTKSMDSLEKAWGGLKGQDLYQYFEYTGFPLSKIEGIYGKDALDGYIDWVYFNIK